MFREDYDHFIELLALILPARNIYENFAQKI